jgi:hypothetical protein
MSQKKPLESSDTKTDQSNSNAPRSPADIKQPPARRGKMYWKFATLRGWRANNPNPSDNNKITDKE